MKKIVVALLGLTILVSSTLTPAASMTKEQGDAILNELRQIRQLLEKEQQPPSAPPAPQAPQHLKVNTNSEFILGDKNAPLTMVEFTDFQCPFCGRFESATFPVIKRNYIDTGKLRLVVRDLPLEGLHPFAMMAAQAAHCAGDQGKYWEMKDILFRNQSKLDGDSLTGYATKDLGLQADSFKSCMATGKHLSDIGKDARYAQSLGITGTPSFVIGKTPSGDTMDGQVIIGALPLENFTDVIDSMLQ